jgi:hypothetical protein
MFSLLHPMEERAGERRFVLKSSLLLDPLPLLRRGERKTNLRQDE